ncbi:classical arabinogalactan protein 7-like [Capsicum chacoense]
MASSCIYTGFLVLIMATSFMGLTTSRNSDSPSPSPSPFVYPPISSPSPPPSSKVNPPTASAPAHVHILPGVSPVPEISPASISLFAPEPATNAAATFSFNFHLAVGSVAAVICAFAFSS